MSNLGKVLYDYAIQSTSDSDSIYMDSDFIEFTTETEDCCLTILNPFTVRATGIDPTQLVSYLEEHHIDAFVVLPKDRSARQTRLGSGPITKGISFMLSFLSGIRILEIGDTIHIGNEISPYWIKLHHVPKPHLIYYRGIADITPIYGIDDLMPLFPEIYDMSRQTIHFSKEIIALGTQKNVKMYFNDRELRLHFNGEYRRERILLEKSSFADEYIGTFHQHMVVGTFEHVTSELLLRIDRYIGAERIKTVFN